MKNIITSQRNFGIELEIGAEHHEQLAHLEMQLPPRYRMVHDGSNRAPNPVEIVSPILKGKRGEQSVRNLCHVLQDVGMIADDPSCGFHVHVDGKEFREQEKISVVTRPRLETLLEHHKPHTIMHLSEDLVEGSLKQDYIDASTMLPVQPPCLSVHRYKKGDVACVPTSEYINGRKIRYTKYSYIDGPLKKLQKKNNKIRDQIEVERNNILRDHETDKISRKEAHKLLEDLNDRIYEHDARKLEDYQRFVQPKGKYIVFYSVAPEIERLKTIFYFYLAYDDVFRGMLPENRIEGNAYCMPLSDSFTPTEIEAVNNQKDFDLLWYKERDWARTPMLKSERYSDSRYHNVNFHSLFNRHGTIEIRSHGSTLDPNKILLWTALHQMIVDKCSSGDITIEDIKTVYKDKIYADTRKKMNHMLGVLDPPEYLAEYITRLYNYFS